MEKGINIKKINIEMETKDNRKLSITINENDEDLTIESEDNGTYKDIIQIIRVMEFTLFTQAENAEYPDEIDSMINEYLPVSLYTIKKMKEIKEQKFKQVYDVKRGKK